MVKDFLEKVQAFFSKEEMASDESQGFWIDAAHLNMNHLGKTVDIDTSDDGTKHCSSLVVGKLQSIRRESGTRDIVYLTVEGNNWVACLDLKIDTKVFVY